MATKKQNQLWDKLMTSKTKPSIASPVKDLGAWGQFKKFHKTGLGKAAIYGTAAGLALKVGIGVALYKAGKSKGQSVSSEVRAINKWAHKEGITSPEQLKAAYKKAHQRRKYMAG